MPPYAQKGDFPVSKRLSRQGMSLPSGNDITDEAIDRVCNAIAEIVVHHQTIQGAA
jgi:dTDP-4-amino-4,6-dideoxygalactose transaminase